MYHCVGASEMLGLKFPITLGIDIAGTVEEVGVDVENFKKGDAVYGMTVSGLSGGYAEYALAGLDTIRPNRKASILKMRRRFPLPR